MATTPSTLIIKSNNTDLLPTKHLLVAVKQMFQFGLLDTRKCEDKILVNLSYSPKLQTLKRKFGSLPISYTRSRVENPEELKILENLIKKFQFNMTDSEDDGRSRELAHEQRLLSIDEPAKSVSSSAKPIVDLVCDTDDDEDNDDDDDDVDDDHDDDDDDDDGFDENVDNDHHEKKKKPNKKSQPPRKKKKLH